MTDQQLLEAGERLYNAFLGSNFTFLELAGLAAARERRMPWLELGQNLKLAIYRLVILSQTEDPSLRPDGSPPPSQAVPVTKETAQREGTGHHEDPGDAGPALSAGTAPDAEATPDPADGGDDTGPLATKGSSGPTS